MATGCMCMLPGVVHMCASGQGTRGCRDGETESEDHACVNMKVALCARAHGCGSVCTELMCMCKVAWSCVHACAHMETCLHGHFLCARTEGLCTDPKICVKPGCGISPEGLGVHDSGDQNSQIIYAHGWWRVVTHDPGVGTCLVLCQQQPGPLGQRKVTGRRPEARKKRLTAPHFPLAWVGGTCEIPRKPRWLPTVSTEELADCSLASASLLFLGRGFLVEGVVVGTWVELPVTHGPGM